MSCRRIRWWSIFSLLLIVPLASHAKSAFSDVSELSKKSQKILKTIKGDKRNSKAKAIRIDAKEFEKSIVMLDLFDRKQLEAVAFDIKEKDGKKIWRGYFRNEKGSETLLFIRDQKISGRISINGDLYLLSQLNDDVHALVQINIAELEPCEMVETGGVK